MQPHVFPLSSSSSVWPHCLSSPGLELVMFWTSHCVPVPTLVLCIHPSWAVGPHSWACIFVMTSHFLCFCPFDDSSFYLQHPSSLVLHHVILSSSHFFSLFPSCSMHGPSLLCHLRFGHPLLSVLISHLEGFLSLTQPYCFVLIVSRTDCALSLRTGAWASGVPTSQLVILSSPQSSSSLGPFTGGTTP